MTVATHIDSEATSTPIPRKFAARALGLSPQTLKKGIDAGVVPEITAGNLSALVNIPVLTDAWTADGVSVPVLRTGVREPSTWDFYNPPRPYTGYAASMSDTEALAAADRWWTRSGSDSVLAAQSMITVIGGWSVLLLAVTGITRELAGGGNCLHYTAALIARCDNVIDREIRIVDPSHPLAPRAHELLGTRVLGGGGGTITRL